MTGTATLTHNEGHMSTPDVSERFTQWIENAITQGTLKPGRALVLGGGAIAETELLVRHGYEVILIDPTGEDIREAKNRRLDLKWGAKMRFNDLDPWQAGHLDLVVDPGTLETLSPEDRFSYANRVGRFLPTGGHLAGVYRLGMGTEVQAPYSLTRQNFQKLLGRYFLMETTQETPLDATSPVSTVLGLFERRSLPRRAPRPR